MWSDTSNAALGQARYLLREVEGYVLRCADRSASDNAVAQPDVSAAKPLLSDQRSGEDVVEMYRAFFSERDRATGSFASNAEGDQSWEVPLAQHRD